MSQPERTDDVVQTLGELGKTGVPVEDPLRAAYRRERIVRLLGTSITAEGRRARRRRALPWFAAAAAAVIALGAAGGLGWFHSGQPSRAVAVSEPPSAGEARLVAGEVSVRRNGQATPLHTGDVFVGGELVSTAAYSVAEIGIASGRAELEGSSELEIVQPTPSERRLRLGTGSVDVDLPHKLGSGKHLIVETPDAEVMVIGTAFTVAVGREHGAASTHVRVRRGTVWIMQGGKQRAVLRAGDEWTSPLATAAAASTPVATPETRVPAVSRAARGSSRRSAPVHGATAARVVESGTLAEENRLFQSGLTARNSGDAAGAADTFATLLSRYPRSVLREQALAEQFRALERAGRGSAAAVAARRYLAGYPNGFARADAERIASGLLGER